MTLLRSTLLFAVLSFCIAAISTSVEATSKVTTMTNQAQGQTPDLHVVPDPQAYFEQKQSAISLVRAQQWEKALPLIQSLTQQYKDDGETWYLLGLSYFNLQQWQQALAPLKQALNLGYRIEKIPTGESNPNDLMLKISKTYAQLEDENNALAWLEKALAARWDDKPKLAGRSLFSSGISTDFKNIQDSGAFKKLAGASVPEGLTRAQKWQLDLNYLVSEIKRLHVDTYHHVSEAKFTEKVHSIRSAINGLDDQQIVFEFMSLLSMLGNGHNFIIPAWGQYGSFTQLPMQFYWFSDGLYIVDAQEPYAHLIGYEVTRFGETPAEKALDLVGAINARDNDMQQLWLAPYYLGLPQVLSGLDIVEDAANVTLTVRLSGDKERTVTPMAHPMAFAGFPKLPALKSASYQRGLSRNSEPYWYEHIADKQLLYAQFNTVRDDPKLSFAEFNDELRQLIMQQSIDNLVIDLRHNSGGDGSITPPMVATAALFEALRPDGKLFILMGRNTFSAGHDLLVDLTRFTQPILVGEPSGTRPNAIGEAGWFNLPYSQQTGVISSQFHQNSSAEDHRIWLAPDVPVSLSSTAYFSGQDSALDAVMSLIE